LKSQYTKTIVRSPLEVAYWSRQISVARLLLAEGAEVHHINADGWTPAFRLFGFSSQASTPCDEYLEALAASSFTEVDAQDKEGWSCMHRAAAFGRAHHIKALMKLHATLIIRTTKVSWTPIFCAVQYGNVATFNELRKHHHDLLVMKDVRQWTLLHVAVNAKRLEIMELLISLGADPHARTFPAEFFVPEDIKGLSVTPGDIAGFRGPVVFSAYVNALRTNGYEIEAVTDEMDDIEDLFWPALDELDSAVHN
jgi:ankyrin repeat protein